MRNSQGYLKVEIPQDLAKRLNLPFNDFLLLRRALTHRSYLNEHPEALEDNERLEFLGDAILDFVVGAWLYNRFPEKSEGDLTRLRAALVKTDQLAKFAIKINLAAALRLGQGEEDGGGRSRPTMLCALFEAVIGALYIDANIQTVNQFIEPLLEEAVDSILKAHQDKDPKSLLQEWAQGEGYNAPFYRIISEDGPDHAKIFGVEVFIEGEKYGIGKGRSKQAASKAAALSAIEKLEI
jgi:ribonuclease-3